LSRSAYTRVRAPLMAVTAARQATRHRSRVQRPVRALHEPDVPALQDDGAAAARELLLQRAAHRKRRRALPKQVRAVGERCAAAYARQRLVRCPRAHVHAVQRQ
jgi:hypothetical protein